MLRRAVYALALMTALSGCIASDNNLTLETVNSFKLVDVAVTFPPDANLSYTKAEDELALSKGVSPNDPGQVEALVKTPDGMAFIQAKARIRMQEAVRRDVAPILQGARPVRVEVAVTAIDVPGTVRSVLLSGTATLQARIRLVDAATGQVYSELPKQSEFAGRAGGVVGTLVQGALEDGGHVDEP